MVTQSFSTETGLLHRGMEISLKVMNKLFSEFPKL